jgi:hypothetical protein
MEDGGGGLFEENRGLGVLRLFVEERRWRGGIFVENRGRGVGGLFVKKVDRGLLGLFAEDRYVRLTGT